MAYPPPGGWGGPPGGGYGPPGGYPPPGGYGGGPPPGYGGPPPGQWGGGPPPGYGGGPPPGYGGPPPGYGGPPPGPVYQPPSGAPPHWQCGRRAQEIPPNADCANQLWFYEGNGVIKNRRTGNVLDVKGKTRKEGTQVICWHANGQTNQQWDFSPEGYIVSRDSGFVLDIPHGKAKAGADIELWMRNPNAPWQQWDWDEWGHICPRADPRMCLDESHGTGEALIVWQKKPVPGH